MRPSTMKPWRQPTSQPAAASGEQHAPSGHAFGEEAGRRSPASSLHGPGARRPAEAVPRRRPATIWNRARLQPAGTVPPARRQALRRAGAGRRNPGRRSSPQMYLLNARTLMQLAERRRGRREDARRACASRWSSGSMRLRPATSWPSTPRRSRRRSRPRARASPGPAEPAGTTSSRATCRRPTRARSRSAATWPRPKARWCSRTSCSSCIEYKPLTAKVYERPILFVPPCINKFYILDLQPENSLIRYTVEQGHRVFVVSWRNPDESIAQRTWDDYIEDGRDQGDRGGAGDHRRRSRSTRWASASAAPSSPRAGGAGGARREAGGEHDAADHLARLQRHRRARHLHRRGLRADCAR